MPRPSHSKKKPGAEEEFKEALCEKLGALGLEAGRKVKVWMMDEARFGLHTELRRVWTRRGQRPVVARQIKYAWDYLYGALSVMGGEAHFAHVPGVSLDWDQGYLGDLAASDPGAIHVLIRDRPAFICAMVTRACRHGCGSSTCRPIPPNSTRASSSGTSSRTTSPTASTRPWPACVPA